MKATSFLIRLYRAALQVLPADFRTRYADEMELLFTERLQQIDKHVARLTTTLRESFDVVLTSLRVRIGRHPLQAPALVTLVMLVALVRPTTYAPPLDAMSPADSVDFIASDPAGDFTLNLRYGRAVKGTIDQYRLSRRQLIHTGDSIRVLNPSGRVLFAVAYDREEARIRWAARPAACRGRALQCDLQ